MGLNSPTAMATVFVPINGAFDAAAAALNTTLDILLAQKPLLTNVSPYLTCHALLSLPVSVCIMVGIWIGVLCPTSLAEWTSDSQRSRYS